VLCAIPLEDILRAADLTAVVRVDGQEDVPALDLALVLLRLQLGNSVADERACDTARGRADGCAAEETHDRSRGDEGPDAGNRQGADPGEPSERAAEETPGARARRGAFGRLRVLLVREISRTLLVREQRRDVA